MLTDDFFLGTKLYNKKLMEFCRPIVKYLGVTQATYVNIDKNGKLFFINSNQKMIEDSIDTQNYKTTTMVVNPKNMHNGFAFDNACLDENYKNSNLYTFITKFDWHNSFIYSEKNSAGGYFAFNFATTKENFVISNRIVNESKIIRHFIRGINNKIISYFKNGIQEASMDFAALRGDSFHTTKGRVFNYQLENEQKNKIQLLRESGILSNHYDEKDLLNKVDLSPQELKCLRIYHATHSIKKVARDLNLATTTVTSYIENIKDKLSCNNKNELFEKTEILESLGHIYL